MSYNFSPKTTDEKARSFLNKRGKQIGIAIIVVFLVSVFYYTGTTLTTYATYNNDLEQDLQSAKSGLAGAQSEIQTYKSSLETSNNQLRTCNSNLELSKTSLSSCSKEKSDLTDEVKVYKTAVETCESKISSSGDSFKQLAKNSVKFICCSYGDVQNGGTRNWDVVGNSIICSGNYTVNCSNGETNY